MDAIDGKLLEVFTGFVGRVKTYDASKQTATIEVGFLREIEGSEEDPNPDPIAIEDLDDVPVRFFSAGGFTIGSSPVPGDKVICFAMQRSLWQWLEGDGSPVVPTPGQHHNVNDCIAFPWNPGAGSEADLVLKGHGAEVRLTTGGKVKLNGGGLAAARKTDAVQVTFSALDIQALALALLSTGAFTPSPAVAAGTAPIPATVPMTPVDGTITGGSSSVEEG